MAATVVGGWDGWVMVVIVFSIKVGRESYTVWWSFGALPKKPHAVCIPFPAQTHIKATLKLTKLLHNRGFHITYVNTEFNHNRFLHTLDGLPDFRFATIPDGLPPSRPDATQDIAALCNSIRKFMPAPFSPPRPTPQRQQPSGELRD